MKHRKGIGWFLSLALVPGTVAAPAIGASTTAAKSSARAALLEPAIIGLAPGMHGEGRGTWRGPAASLGRLRATSSVSPDGPSFAFDAAIVRAVPMGPHGPEIEGAFFGEMLALDPVAGPEVVASVVGQWTQEVDGSGWFVGHILLPTGDPLEPVLAVGRCCGAFRTPAPDSGRSQEGPASIRWDVAW